MLSRKQLGKFGEDIAVKYLKKRGYKILARNWQNKWGEIDIVASPPTTFLQKVVGGKKKKIIVFCEVKTIEKKPGFSPEDEIDWKKERQLSKMAQIYLSSNKIPLESPWRIDVLAIEIDPFSENPSIRHFENVIEDSY